MQDMDTARQEVLDLQAKAKIALEVFNKSQKDVLTNETDLQKYRTKAKEQEVPPPCALYGPGPIVERACCHICHGARGRQTTQPLTAQALPVPSTCTGRTKFKAWMGSLKT